MKAKQIREFESGHLNHELAEKQKHLFTLRTQAVTEKLEDPTQIIKTRREIARLKTILRERQIAEGAASTREAAVSAKEQVK